MASIRAMSSLLSRVSTLRTPFTPIAPRTVSRSRVVVVRAAQAEVVRVKKPLYGKRTDPAVKRAELAIERRRYNRSRKSACGTRIKKVIKLAESMMAALPTAEDEVKPLEKLISEAFQEIDKAIVKGVLHKNTGARKKARVSRHKKKVLIAAGLFVPAADHADYKQYLRVVSAAAAAAPATA